MPTTLRNRILSYAPNGLKRFIRSLWYKHAAISPPAPAKRDEWSIGIYRGSSPFCFAPADTAHCPVLTKSDVRDVPAGYVADPFMIKADGTWYLFFEVLNDRTNKGEIGLATSRDGMRWCYQRIVLDEPFHLSYPYVFEWNNQFFMVPETFQANSVRLYRAEAFPYRWFLIATLLEGKDYVDPSVVRFDDKWWLFTSRGTPPRRAERLHLFFADDLTGPWHEHPKSPVIDGNAQIARPGGRVINVGGKVIRYTQDCSTTYGRQVRASEITDLSTVSFSERVGWEDPVLKPSKDGWNEMGMHHIDPHLLEDGTWMACVDGWSYVDHLISRSASSSM
jgi:hypothetical protein